MTFAEDAPSSSDVDDLASSEATDLLLAIIRAGRGDVARDLDAAEYWPRIVVAASGAIEVSDCVVMATRPAGQPDAEVTVRTQVWTGTLQETGNDLQLTGISVGIDRCVPQELNAELLASYQEYHRAWTSAWDPPDPEHPLLEQTMTGERLDSIRRLLQADQEAGIAFRDPHDPLEHAVVLDLGIGRATVSDCHPAHPGYGAFDAETGERLADEVPEPEPGELHLTSVEMVRDTDGRWRVEQAALLTESNCEPGGTTYVVAP